MHRVAILTYDNVALFELGCAVELFGLPRPEFDKWYECDVVSFSRGPLNSTAGIQLQSKFIESLEEYTFLVIPSWPTALMDIPESLEEEVKKFHRDGKRIISFCAGAFLLAQLGLFGERPATTHWRYAGVFRERFPNIDYVDDVLYLYDGQIGCSAGSSAAIDLGLEVIRNDFGYQVANSVARRLVLSAHRKGGQSQFVETTVQERSGQFNASLEWALKNLSADIEIDALARKSNMSRRSFDRKFRADFNLTPKEWLTHQRLNLAKELLEGQGYSVEKVAELSGFGNATTMRHHFRKELGVSPSIHRKHFKFNN